MHSVSRVDDDFERTWDGEPISREPPYGAMVVVYRQAGHRSEFLVLHRGQYGPEFAGEWAWGPPSGARYPGEAIDRCAARELVEETGLDLSPRRTDAGSADWFVYLAAAPSDADVQLSDEHDRYAWLPLVEAAACITPADVRASFLAAAARLACA